MLEPSTSPSGRNPASRTSRNSLTDRSEVNRLVAWPGRISARRRIASSGMPSWVGSAVTRSPGWSAQWKVGQRAGGGGDPAVEPHQRGAEERRLGDMVAMVLPGLDLPGAQVHRRHDGTLGPGGLHMPGE